TRLLKEDVNGDTIIDYKDKLLKPYDEFYEPIVQKIYKDEYIYDDVYSLV
ncbi:hypothetical protein JHD49_11500, partial [Sulfurimonas sp. SAG-AH-194-C21]|nr:hypothetical protein [Sulfurimonas sp. SAG-AH-194-C21]